MAIPYRFFGASTADSGLIARCESRLSRRESRGPEPDRIDSADTVSAQQEPNPSRKFGSQRLGSSQVFITRRAKVSESLGTLYVLLSVAPNGLEELRGLRRIFCFAPLSYLTACAWSGCLSSESLTLSNSDAPSSSGLADTDEGSDPSLPKVFSSADDRELCEEIEGARAMVGSYLDCCKGYEGTFGVYRQQASAGFKRNIYGSFTDRPPQISRSYLFSPTNLSAESMLTRKRNSRSFLSQGRVKLRPDVRGRCAIKGSTRKKKRFQRECRSLLTRENKAYASASLLVIWLRKLGAATVRQGRRRLSHPDMLPGRPGRVVKYRRPERPVLPNASSISLASGALRCLVKGPRQ